VNSPTGDSAAPKRTLDMVHSCAPTDVTLLTMKGEGEEENSISPYHDAQRKDDNGIEEDNDKNEEN